MTDVSNFQTGILLPVPAHARYLTFALRPGADPRPALGALRGVVNGRDTVVGIGESLAQALGANIEGLRGFPQFAGAAIDLPVTPAALWIWARGSDRGELLHRGRSIERLLGRAFRRERIVDGFRHQDGRDLSGYLDGTENPKGRKALVAALMRSSSGCTSSIAWRK
jgi:putative iron-dependent peroxidase